MKSIKYLLAFTSVFSLLFSEELSLTDTERTEIFSVTNSQKNVYKQVKLWHGESFLMSDMSSGDKNRAVREAFLGGSIYTQKYNQVIQDHQKVIINDGKDFIAMVTVPFQTGKSKMTIFPLKMKVTVNTKENKVRVIFSDFSTYSMSGFSPYDPDKYSGLPRMHQTFVDNLNSLLTGLTEDLKKKTSKIVKDDW